MPRRTCDLQSLCKNGQNGKSPTFVEIGRRKPEIVVSAWLITPGATIPDRPIDTTITLAKFDGFAHNAPVRMGVRVV